MNKNVKPIVEKHEPLTDQTLHTSLRKLGNINQEDSVELTPTEAQELSTRCQKAAKGVLGLVKLRKVQQRQAFQGKPFHEHLAVLAQHESVDLAHVLARFGLEDDFSYCLENVMPMARLARELGIGVRQALVQILLGFLKEAGVKCTVQPMATRGNTVQSIQKQYEESLDSYRVNCSDDQKKHFQQIEKEVHSAYEDDIFDFNSD